VVEVDGDGRIHDFHAQRTEELFVPPAQFLGKRVDEVLPTHAAAIILGALREVVRKGSHGRAKYALDMPSGRRWYDLVIAPKGETRGAAARYLVIARDVTEREQVTAALQASEQRLALALNAASDGVYNVDLRTGEAYYSPGYYTMLGFEPGEFAPSDAAWESLLHPDDRERALAMLDRCVSGDVDEAETEFRLRTKTGEWRRIVSRGRIVARDEHARAIRLVGTHRDVTAESEAREEIRRERDLAQAYLDIAEVMLVAFDPEGRVTLINRKGCRLLEYETPGELLGRDWFATCLPPGSVDETRAVFRRMMAGEIEAVEYHENPVVTKSGRQKDMAWHNALLRDRDGRIAGALSSGEDITERREAEAALVERERRYRELANDLPTCVFEADLGGRLTFANRTGLDWFGYREAEIADGKTLFDMVVGEERGRAATTLRRTIVDGLVPSGEYTAVRKDRSTFPALVSSRAVVKDGRAVGIRGILIDITERVEAARRIENALAGTIRALAVTTEMRDPYTAGHQERVTELACAIGRELGLSMDRLEGLRVAGTLHDIGKVSVPAEILSKPTSLTPTEFGLVKVHPEAGYEILRAISFPWPVADIVLQHHERVDGTGYPRGLHGDAILLEARILAVADVVEAIVSHRPYRPAQRMERAVEELARGAGTLYDRDVVAACQRLFDRGGLPPME
ncbi:MAG: PAS domain S-box protein, partial [Candidatus Bipolaricaulis sp.]|nr:PAS domain S-box protein [Candidatus Bipolaricaulis sp.]